MADRIQTVERTLCHAQSKKLANLDGRPESSREAARKGRSSMMAHNRRVSPTAFGEEIESFPHEEGFKEYLPSENADSTTNWTLYLNLSAIFGVHPLHSRKWPTACLVASTLTTAIVIWLNVKTHRADWAAHGKSLMAGLLLLFGIASTNMCVLLFYYKAVKNKEAMADVWSQIDRTLRWPNAFVVFEGICFAVGGVAHWNSPLTLGVLTQEISVVYNFIVILILAQYGGILNHFSVEISKLKTRLETEGPSGMLASLENYFYIRDMIERTNGIYSCQMVLVVAKVFLKSVMMGYFLIAKTETITVVVSAVVPEAAMLVFITMNCYNAQRAATMINLELSRALRNHPDLHRDNKLALVLKLNKPLDFTAGSFLTLGNGLITSMVAAVTTYLVTLVDLSGEASDI